MQEVMFFFQKSGVRLTYSKENNSFFSECRSSEIYDLFIDPERISTHLQDDIHITSIEIDNLVLNQNQLNLPLG